MGENLVLDVDEPALCQLLTRLLDVLEVPVTPCVCEMDCECLKGQAVSGLPPRFDLGKCRHDLAVDWRNRLGVRGQFGVTRHGKSLNSFGRATRERGGSPTFILHHSRPRWQPQSIYSDFNVYGDVFSYGDRSDDDAKTHHAIL